MSESLDQPPPQYSEDDPPLQESQSIPHKGRPADNRSSHSPRSLTVKIADRPHWIAILLGCLSPSIAVVALILSVLALKQSSDSFKIGQRAYVFGAFYLGDEVPPSSEGATKQWRLGLSFNNTGSTPARITDVSLSEECGKKAKPESLRTAGNACYFDLYQDKIPPFVVGGRDVVKREVGATSFTSLIVSLTGAPRLTLGMQPLVATFSYQDVFHNTHQVKVDCKFDLEHEALHQFYCENDGDDFSSIERPATNSQRSQPQ